ncbi:hypothetical protein KFU94_46350 [Chloroflexi bacterium TSY]|nr:hypothetical protein [Chloroflexi bacterium TSY]
MQTLLAVDLGLRAGLALFRKDRQLLWYRSLNFGSITRMRSGVYSILSSIPNLGWVILEGGGSLSKPWLHEVKRREIPVHQIGAERWRQVLLHPRQQRNGTRSKQSADELARQVITWANGPQPTSLRHDAAEAILIGLWGMIEVGWLDGVPIEFRK